MQNNIDDKTLIGYLKSDLKLIGLPTDFELDLRGYSKAYYGRYYIVEKKVVLYAKDENGNTLPYHELLDTVMHEAIHHYQYYYEEGFKRVKGVMHNPKFKAMYSECLAKLHELEVIPCA